MLIKPKCRVSPTESEYEMNLDELVAHLEVRTNVLEEANRIAEQKRRNVTAMLAASNQESQ